MELNKIIDNMKDEIIKHTQDIIKIRSVEAKAKEGMPFGEEVDKALKYALNLCDNMGFKTKNFDGYAGHADLGSQEETVGILVHLDVVPEGDINTWTYPPYEAQIHDGKIFGRGAIDDKGPAISAIYAMKALEKSNIFLSKKIRIIFGTNEETGSECIKYYLTKEKPPQMAFTPDADYPVIHGEQGIIVFDYDKKFESNRNCPIKVKSIKGGNRPNMVPDYCEAILKIEDTIYVDNIKSVFEKFISENNYKLELTIENSAIVVKSYGISAHGSTPQYGQNAISQLIEFLCILGLDNCDAHEFIKFYKEKIGMNYNGENAGCGLEDKESGKLVFNVGIIDFDEEKVKLTVNVRYPVTYNLESVMNGIKDTLKECDIDINIIEHKAPLYIPKDNELVQKLMKVYREVTGDEKAEPITMGGGTYARSMQNAVAFGVLFPGQEDTMHQKDEYIAIDDLIKNTKIFAKALYELAK